MRYSVRVQTTCEEKAIHLKVSKAASSTSTENPCCCGRVSHHNFWIEKLLFFFFFCRTSTAAVVVLVPGSQPAGFLKHSRGEEKSTYGINCKEADGDKAGWSGCWRWADSNRTATSAQRQQFLRLHWCFWQQRAWHGDMGFLPRTQTDHTGHQRIPATWSQSPSLPQNRTERVQTFSSGVCSPSLNKTSLKHLLWRWTDSWRKRLNSGLYEWM